MRNTPASLEEACIVLTAAGSGVSSGEDLEEQPARGAMISVAKSSTCQGPAMCRNGVLLIICGFRLADSEEGFDFVYAVNGAGIVLGHGLLFFGIHIAEQDNGALEDVHGYVTGPD